jgi:hypothetical protein
MKMIKRTFLVDPEVISADSSHDISIRVTDRGYLEISTNWQQIDHEDYEALLRHTMDVLNCTYADADEAMGKIMDEQAFRKVARAMMAGMSNGTRG